MKFLILLFWIPFVFASSNVQEESIDKIIETFPAQDRSLVSPTEWKKIKEEARSSFVEMDNLSQDIAFKTAPMEEKINPGFDAVVYSNASGGDIPIGSVLQGNTFRGGGMPDVFVDSIPPKLIENINRFADEEGVNKNVFDLNTFFKKIRVAERAVQRTIIHFEYSNKIKEGGYSVGKRKYGKNIGVPISFFANYGLGDCRIYALMLHLALKELGVPSEFIYAKVGTGLQRGSWITRKEGNLFIEDHAMNLVRHPISGEKILLDAYFPAFNGFYLKDILGNQITGAKRLPEIKNTHDQFAVFKDQKYGKDRVEWGKKHYVDGLKWTEGQFKTEFDRLDSINEVRTILQMNPFPMLMVNKQQFDKFCVNAELNQMITGNKRFQITGDLNPIFTKEELELKKNAPLISTMNCAPKKNIKERSPQEAETCAIKIVESKRKTVSDFISKDLNILTKNFPQNEKLKEEFISNVLDYCR